MKEQLQNIQASALTEISTACDQNVLEAVRIKYLGKKGELTAILRGMGALSAEERPAVGALANTVREEIEKALVQTGEVLKQKSRSQSLLNEKLDVTLPAVEMELGGLHPITLISDKMKEIFIGMGFDVVEGPEIESVYNNFDALNAPADHPSRDLQDTFYIDQNTILRTQTSTVQIRTMKNKQPPIRVISPGKAYRVDEVDATHSPMFFQLEGLVVDKNVTMGNLKSTLSQFAKSFFGENTKTRFRPHNFPFTEPSAEVDISCFICGGKGCRVCKNEGWIELLGAGMVHPNVLSACGIDPQIYSGFAFGMGIERCGMGKFSIDDLRHFYDNDLRFLKQF